MNSKFYEANGYGHGHEMDLLFISYKINYMFYILQEVGAKRKMSILACTSLWYYIIILIDVFIIQNYANVLIKGSIFTNESSIGCLNITKHKRLCLINITFSFKALALPNSNY